MPDRWRRWPRTFGLTHSMTYHQAQGQTIATGKKAALIGSCSPHFDHSRLVVGVSRMERGQEPARPLETRGERLAHGGQERPPHRPSPA